MQKIEISPSTTLYFGKNILFESLAGLCQTHLGKIVMIADSVIKDLDTLAADLHAEFLTFPAGETVKTKKMQTYLENRLFKMGCNRDTLLIAIGGGSMTDLVGFVASIYLRGVSLIFIPTSLLAMVDAAIGGKTAINTPFGKNLIGTLYHPKAIIVDLNMLKTLPENEWLNGLAEILKLGLVFDASVWSLAKEDPKNEQLIFKAIQGKVNVVQQDPTEQGLRRILNFGHTIGHALEAISKYTIAHGEAVAIGSIAEAHLSMQLGYLSKEDFEQILTTYKAFPLHLPKNSTKKSLFKALTHDKKNSLGKVHFVLIDRIGHALCFEGQYCRAVDEEELEPTWKWIEKKYG